MLALVLRGFMQRKLRVLLTAIAIALGVALMAGTYILTDTINNSFAGIFKTANEGHDVVVTPAQRLGSRVRSEVSPITEATLARCGRCRAWPQASGGHLQRRHVPRRARQAPDHRWRPRVRRLRGAQALRVLLADRRALSRQRG